MQAFDSITRSIKPVNERRSSWGFTRAELPPVVFQDRPHRDVSDRYEFIPTAKVVDALDREGYSPVGYSVGGVRDRSKDGFQKHAITFRHRDVIGEVNVPEELAEVTIANSHDRGCSFVIAAGIFRFVCSNGMIVADGEATFHRVRHTGLQVTVDNVVRATLRAARQANGAVEEVGNWKQTPTTEPDRLQFAKQCHALRWRDESIAPVPAEALLKRRRRADNGDDVWTVLNRVQENVLRGGQRDLNRRREARFDRRRYTASRAVNGISDRLRLNEGIWAAATETFELNGN